MRYKIFSEELEAQMDELPLDVVFQHFVNELRHPIAIVDTNLHLLLRAGQLADPEVPAENAKSSVDYIRHLIEDIQLYLEHRKHLGISK
jgi:hypothetical protein